MQPPFAGTLFGRGMKKACTASAAHAVCLETSVYLTASTNVPVRSVAALTMLSTTVTGDSSTY
jgi:hypothetical protein